MSARNSCDGKNVNFLRRYSLRSLESFSFPVRLSAYLYVFLIYYILVSLSTYLHIDARDLAVYIARSVQKLVTGNMRRSNNERITRKNEGGERGGGEKKANDVFMRGLLMNL